VMHRDARYFPQPDRFVPERWLESKAAQLPRFAYFPFGGGPRTCIGNHYAQMEAALVLATMTQQVELRVVPGYKLELDPIVTLRPLRGLPVLVRRRQPAARRAPDTTVLSA
jgi:cytochrome P450